ncbi:MAG: hypothetical protein H0U18_13325 [Pyrinomonadaceae bacterium]|nr:hypothetical protein [Pyrinomonadaceae bacterium]
MLKVIASKGADPAASRATDLHFWAFGEASARELSAALEAQGYSPVSINAAAGDPSLWNVETNIEASPLTVAAPFFVEKLVRLASEHNANSMVGALLSKITQQSLAPDSVALCWKYLKRRPLTQDRCQLQTSEMFLPITVASDIFRSFGALRFL